MPFLPMGGPASGISAPMTHAFTPARENHTADGTGVSGGDGSAADALATPPARVSLSPELQAASQAPMMMMLQNQNWQMQQQVQQLGLGLG